MRMENIEDLYELSPMQQGLLFHTLYAPRSGVYFEQYTLTLRGDLNVPAFERAWHQVVDRHPVLRTSFYWEGFDKPFQAVNRQVSLALEQHDWRDLSPGEQEQRLELWIKADRERGFDLSRAPLMRLAIMRTAEETVEFVWSWHHLLLDRWSRALVLKEVFAFYKAFCQGRERHLERSRPYGEYIAWLQQQDRSEAERFWRHTLKGFTTPTPLGVDRSKGGSTSHEATYNIKEVRLSTATTDALQSFVRQRQLTLNTVVQSAWALLLSRYSSEQDVLFGAVVSGRPASLAGVESIVGCLINTLPVRVQVPADDTLLSWLKRLQAQLVELLQYECSSLVEIQGWSDVPRGLPLFESLLVFENIPVESSWRESSGRLEVRNARSVGGWTDYPLTFFVVPDSELRLGVIYDCYRFDAPTINRMLGHLQVILEAMLADPGQRLSALPLLTGRERRQLLVEWNDTRSGRPEGRCVHQLFEAQAEKTPEAVAVVFEGQQLTYRELNARANQLAHYLRKRGVGPEVLVGLCLERSLEMMVGLLGVLKAGGAYVPLDPDYPKERLAFMLEDAEVPLLLTQQRLLEGLPDCNAEVVCLDADWGAIALESRQEPVSGVTPENLAYVIYTSGSTGKPKGVQVLHGGVVNLLDSVRRQPGLTSRDTLLAVTTLSFDIAALELYLPLIVGARLEVVSRELASDGAGLLGRLAGSGATVMQATPATWRLLLEAGWQGSDQLRIICGGEALPRELADELLARGASVWNLYGPTETTIWSAAYEVQSGQGPVPLGRPVANTQIYLLDRHLRPVPIGVAGELHIGGLGVARGYLNRPELTAEKFVPNPFGGEPGARLYKTGDLARYREDGNIEYLGRLDHQVKLRGFRIELGEVEAALGQHPAVGQAVVLAREDVPGDRRLVAYMVLRQQPAPVISELRGFLKQRLPDYMVPSAFVPLERLPLTPNGKLDRRALPAPDQARPELGKAFVAPRSPVEEVLAGIWREVLGVERVGVLDNFFELGGHSLLATQVISRLRNAFQLDLPLRTLFETPTVGGLAVAVVQFLAEKKGRAGMAHSFGNEAFEGFSEAAMSLSPLTGPLG